MMIKSGLILCTSAAMMLIMPASASFAGSSATAKTTMTTAQCEALFEQADTDHDGSLTSHEDPKWQERVARMGTVQPKDAMIIHKDDFMAACKSGDFDNM